MDFPLRHFESADSLYSNHAETMTMPAKIAARMHARTLHIQAPPKSHRRYHSEEEAPSPVEEEDYSELSSRSDAESSQDEITIDPTIDLDALEVLHSSPYETAEQITILCSGRAAEIFIGRPAPRRRGALTGRSESPIQKMSVPRRSSRRRQRSISLYDPTAETLGCAFSSTTPTQASFHSSRSSSASRSRSSSAVRSSSSTRSVTNFSAPMRNPNRPRPSRLASHQSTSSFESGTHVPSLSHGGPDSPAETDLLHEEDDSDSDAVMRESLEVQVRTRSAERTRQLALSGADGAQYSDPEELEPSAAKDLAPATYDVYDAYGLDASPPQHQLGGGGHERRGSAVATVARKWKGFARVGRHRGRRDATAGFGESGW